MNVKAVTKARRRPYLLVTGIQSRLPGPWKSAVQLKKQGVFAMGPAIVSFQVAKNSRAV
jgi:hypothetical protein